MTKKEIIKDLIDNCKCVNPKKIRKHLMGHAGIELMIEEIREIQRDNNLFE